MRFEPERYVDQSVDAAGVRRITPQLEGQYE
jgi:hypothetical protein